MPKMLHAVRAPCAGSNIERLAAICDSDFGEDVFIDPLLRDGAFATSRAAVGLFFVLVIQPELNGAQNQIQCLQVGPASQRTSTRRHV